LCRHFKPGGKARVQTGDFEYRCRLKTVTPQRALVVKALVQDARDVGRTIQSLLEEVWGYLSRQEHATVGPGIARFHRFEAEPIELEAGFPVAERFDGDGRVRPVELPGGGAATTLHHGPYDGLPLAYQALERFMREQKLRPAGSPYEIYWIDGSQAREPEELRTEVVWPVE
jgi:effector-binding domain-containing protein